MKKLFLIAILCLSFGIASATVEAEKENFKTEIGISVEQTVDFDFEVLDFEVDSNYAEIVYDLKAESLTFYEKDLKSDNLEYLISLDLKNSTYEQNQNFKDLTFDLFEVDEGKPIERLKFKKYSFAYCFLYGKEYKRNYKKIVAKEASKKIVAIKTRPNRNII
jgi:hypothetical protein